MRVGDLLELLKTLDVVLGRLAAGTGTRSRNGIGSLDQNVEHRVGVDIGMMGFDRVDDNGLLAITAGKLGANDSMRALNVVIDGLAQVVQKTSALGGHNVQTKLGGHNAAQVGNLKRVLQHVLTKRGAVAQSAQSLDNLGVQVVDTGIEGGLLASLTHTLLNQVGSLVIHLFDAGGVNAAVGNKVLERHAGSLTTDRIEARKHDGLGGVVNHEVDARHLLKGADVATLATNDATLEVIGGNMHGSDSDLGGMVGGATLDRQGENLLGGLVALGADLLLGLTDDGGRLVGNLAADLVEQLLVSILTRKVGNTLELGSLLGTELLKLARALLDLTGLAGQLMFALIERIVATIERFLALHHTIFERANLALTLLVLGLGGLLVLDDLLFSLEQSLFFEGLGLTLSITDQGLSLCVCRLDLFVGLVKTTLLGGAHVGNGGDGTQNDANERCDDRHAHSFLWIRYTTKRTVLTNGSRHLSNMGAAYAGRIQINI